MALQLSNVPFKLTPQDMGTPDIMASLLQGQKFGNQLAQFPLQQQILQAQAQYAQPMAQAGLQHAQLGNQNQKLQNQWYSPEMQSRISMQNAQTGNLGLESKKLQYLLNNPLLMGGDDSKTLGALVAAGIINPSQLSDNNRINIGSTSPQVQQGTNPYPYTPIDPNTQQNQGMSNQKYNGIPQQQQNGSFSPYAPFNTGNQLADAILNRKYAASANQNANTQGFAWVHAPADAKIYSIAQAAGMGIDPTEATREFTEGKTIQQIAQDHGFDPSNMPDPDFLPTQGNIGKLKQRQAALKEVDSLSNFVTSGLSPYSQTINGYSPSQIVGAISGSDPDTQAKFLAARALSPELNNVRLMLAQARTGKSAMQSMSDKSMNNINAFQSLVTPKVFVKAQKLINDQLSDAFENSENAYKIGGNKRAKSVSDAIQKQNSDFSKISDDELRNIANGQ